MTDKSENNSDDIRDDLFSESINNIRRVLDPIVEGSRGGVLALFVLTLIMWVLNITGLEAVNLLLAYVGLFLIFFAFTMPKLILVVIPVEGFSAWLRDEDASQGAAESLGKLSKIAIWIFFAFSMNSLVLATWSFSESPMSFWGLELIVITFAAWGAVYNARGNMSKKLTSGYLVIAAVALIWSTFGITLDYGVPDQVRDESGNIVVMYNPVTKEFAPEVDVKSCTIKRPCYAADGNALEPVTQESVNNRNPKVWIGTLVDFPYFWQTLVGIVTLTLLLVFVPGVRGAIVPVAIVAALAGAVWYMFVLEGVTSSVKASAVATSTTDCGGKITPKVMETFILKKGCSYIFDQRLMPDGFDIAPTQAGIDGKLFWTENTKHRTTAGRKEARIDTVEDAFVGRNELRMFFAPFGSSDGEIKLMRDRLTKKSAARLTAATAKLLAEAK